MRKATFLLALLVLLVVSVSIVTADNDSSDVLSIDDNSGDVDLEKISADTVDKDKASVSDKKDKLSDDDVQAEQGFKVKKVWKGDDESDRPSQIEFNLKLNGERWGEEPTILDKENNWETFVEADLSADDKVEVEEVEVPGYTSEVTGDAKKGFTITNTLNKEDDNETATDDDDTSGDDASDDTSVDSQPEKTTTTTTTTKVVKKQPEKVKDKHKTGNPILLGVLAISVAGLAYQLSRKE